eukprot:6975622-Prorocentrum_lima.AAC.1
MRCPQETAASRARAELTRCTAPEFSQPRVRGKSCFPPSAFDSFSQLLLLGFAVALACNQFFLCRAS